MNHLHEHNQYAGRGNAVSITLLLVLIFFVLDAGAVAWSASVISSGQLAAGLVTFFAVVTGAAITYRAIRTAR
jgi:hypothetical protein